MGDEVTVEVVEREVGVDENCLRAKIKRGVSSYFISGEWEDSKVTVTLFYFSALLLFCFFLTFAGRCCTVLVCRVQSSPECMNGPVCTV